jgi:hypothetical protein
MGAGIMQRLYRMGGAALGGFAIVLQYALIVRYKTDGNLVAAAILRSLARASENACLCGEH